MSTVIKNSNMANGFEDLFKPRNEEKETEHDSYMLMSAFLNQIEEYQEKKNISRKELAEKIGTSPSYLTQVFRNKKPLNFTTLAKIKRAMNLKFEVRAFDFDDIVMVQGEKYVPFNMTTILIPINAPKYVYITDKNKEYV